MTMPSMTLVSHALCPYVQRVAIVLAEKGVPHARRDVDLSSKPDWFLRWSPLGRTPVLRVGEVSVFESAVICEYVDETHGVRLHPADALERARHRAWIEFGSSVLSAIAAYYSAPDDETLAARDVALRGLLARVEAELGLGPWFGGESFGIVDAAFGPVFRYLDAFEAAGEPSFTTPLPRMHAWRWRLAERPSVRGAIGDDYPERLTRFLRARGSALSRRMALGPPGPTAG